MNITNEQVEVAQAVYTKQTLAVYDLVVLGFSNQFIWKCPTKWLMKHYNQMVTANHLDVGIGTGYFLDRCKFPSQTPRVALIDLNSNTLEFTSQRIARYNPKTYGRNILEPINLDAEKFDSVGINYVFHCLPGTLETKSVALDYLKALMNPNGVLFGSTILQGGVSRNWFAKRLMAIYNKKGFFSNQYDNLEELKSVLNQRFKDISVEVIGCVALFSGRV
ncbi:MAG: class I SAM-dependent methyltransferase [Okeania sp. SIO3B5]|uniref:class I SAM-dependent methyltransferase n=1 Tax=Okeania sp. SIO3B5 TaxID=2607811 RepID=UPI00140182F7|nr:class I SAM-dependent methyltransferase [Okeania sp. SIO3B5]NEO56405.1 class I SAM-dependent methyltransferase [Okeania sp. SIO3B5]